MFNQSLSNTNKLQIHQKNRPTVLIVDDNEAICRILSETLVSRGCECDFVGEANDALARLSERYFDVILLDIKLPQKSGIDLLKDIESFGSDTVTIMISAVVDPDTLGEAWRRGCADYIIKPFRIQDVILSVEKALAFQHINNVWRRRLGI
jgi:DNA-binding NtrC family response regulator